MNEGERSEAERDVAGVRQATVHTFDAASGEGSVITDSGVVVPFTSEAWRSGPLLTMRVGQRLRVEIEQHPTGPRVRFLTLATFAG